MRGTVDAPPSPTLTQGLLALVDTIRVQLGDLLIDAAIGYNTVLIMFDPNALPRTTLLNWLNDLAVPTVPELEAASSEPTVTLPVYYHDEVAPDLEPLSRSLGLSTAEIITRHTGCIYFAYATGFTPGFCYLGNLDATLQRPRREAPRAQVPAGSVAIAEQQTAVYPRVSPGGWHILGRCPLRLFDLKKSPANRIAIGDWVKFESISRAEFLALGGEL